MLMGMMGGAKKFRVTDISNLALWLDAIEDSTVIRDGSNLVSQWTDKSTSALNAVQATGSKQPLYEATGMGNRPCLTFDGSSDAMTVGTTSSFNFLHNGAACTVFVVSKVNVSGSGTNHRILASGTSAATSVGYDFFFRDATITNSATLQVHAGVASNHLAFNTSAGVALPLTPYIMGTTQDGAGSVTARIYTNGTIRATGTQNVSASSSNATHALTLGAHTGGTAGYGTVSISEIIIYSHLLATSDIAKVVRYLANKWGI